MHLLLQNLEINNFRMLSIVLWHRVPKTSQNLINAADKKKQWQTNNPASRT